MPVETVHKVERRSGTLPSMKHLFGLVLLVGSIALIIVRWRPVDGPISVGAAGPRADVRVRHVGSLGMVTLADGPVADDENVPRSIHDAVERLVLEHKDTLDPRHHLSEALKIASRVIHHLTPTDPGRLFGHATSLLLVGNKLTAAQAGLTQAWLVRGGKATRLTEDNSVAAQLHRSDPTLPPHVLRKPVKETSLLEQLRPGGEPEPISPHRMATKLVGFDEELAADTTVIDVEKDDLVVLLSSEVNDALPDGAVSPLVAEVRHPDEAPALREKLIEQGARDTCVVGVVRVERTGAR